MKQILLLPALVLNAQNPGIQVRIIHQPWSTMPVPRDLSSPEGSLAAVIRVLLDGGEIRPLFAKSIQGRLPSDLIKAQPEKTQALLRPLVMDEVHQAGDGAAILSVLGDGSLSVRYLEFEEGHWACLGEDGTATMEEGRKLAGRFLSGQVKSTPQAPIAHAEAKLASFVSYLDKHGKEPKELLLEAMASHRLTALGEIHNRPLSWATYTALVQDPRFAQRVGTLFLELPANGQVLMDRFLAADGLDPSPLLDILRDLYHDGWPDQAMVDFLSTLWKVNHFLPMGRKIRVCLVDQAWDWRAIRTKEDLPKLQQDRDSLMARRILEDLEQNTDPRHAVFLVGYLHLPAKLTLRLDPSNKLQNAGTRLREKLGNQLYAVMQHGPVLANSGGGVYGRIRQGLFDEAFLHKGNQPLAFALPGSPFGQEPFDSSWDLRGYQGTYGGAFDAYLYLGPLEQETFAPMVPGFYTEAYATEVDRRCQLLYGTGVKEAEDLKGSDAAAITEGAARLWGQPRQWIGKLGPVGAWRK